MSTIVRNVQLGHHLNIRVNKGANTVNKKRRAADVVVPTVKGLRSIVPSVKGMQDRKYFAQALKKTAGIARGLDVILTARRLAVATGDEGLAELANDPKIIEAMKTALKRIGRDVDWLVREQVAAIEAARAAAGRLAFAEAARSAAAEAAGANAANEDENPEAQRTDTNGRFLNAPSEGDPNAAAGLIGDAGVNYFAMDHETRIQREKAAEKAQRIRAAIAMGDTQNAVRAQFGLDPVPVCGDDLYAMFEGKK
ncbi:hypothetical protein [Burkholderia ubonensis]|uniref:hypothetical protein n=1 Tax=Burkholderia ubonensis TaxID=101571 RepID=UPI000B001B1B|nr:hypothetical protein [Burkholderia ubonensis]